LEVTMRVSAFLRKMVVASVSIVALLPANGFGQPLSFTHLAGPTGGAGPTDGPAGVSSFGFPLGIAADAAGNLYVADTGNHRIRKIAPNGTVSTLAGSGIPGKVDGTGSTASFNSPTALAVDPDGFVWVADTNNDAIRKVSAAGVVSTVPTFKDVAEPDLPALLSPQGIAVDRIGRVYVSDTGHHRIVSIGSTVVTVAGSGYPGFNDGMGAASAFYGPAGIVIDPTGTIFVADMKNNRIRWINSSGKVGTVAGTGQAGNADGSGDEAKFYQPFSVGRDGAGNLFVSDRGNNVVRMITTSGNVKTLAGSGSIGSDDGAGSAASFAGVAGLVSDASGTVWLVDEGNHSVRMIEAGTVSTFAGTGRRGSADGLGTAASFNAPAGVAVDGSGSIYVADTNNNLVRKVSVSGYVTTLAGSGVSGSSDGVGTAASFARPAAVAADSAGSVYVADTFGNRIRKISPSGAVTLLAGSGRSGNTDGNGGLASFFQPNGVAVDSLGDVYVADTMVNSIRKITPEGVVSTLAGSTMTGSNDGTGSGASFSGPRGVAVDGSGNVYVGDTGNHLVRKVTPSGTVTTLAGSGKPGSADGTGVAASFTSPAGVAVDALGNVYVADTGNNKLRRVTPDGVTTTVGGRSDNGPGSVDGIGSLAGFARPQGVAVGPGGSVYVADTGNSSIRVGAATGGSGCVPDAASLCLLNGRFRVTAEYRDYGGTAGQGRAIPLTSDTGYFWFIDPSNVEVVAKMVSFCGSGSNNVGIYAGGLTDLDVTVHVTDTRTRTTSDYRNPLGTRFQLVRDGPFGCPAGVTGGSEDVGARAPEGGSLPETASPRSDREGQAACSMDASTLCLLDGRFQVRAAYRDYGGNTGTGRAVALTGDTGSFWFFDAKNVEVITKMVRFCGSGVDRIAVYAGGLTDIEVALSVTDVQTGLTESYTNPLGTPFQLIRDGPFSCQ
jgi:sugar lactone lactonase YvrE